MTRHPSSVRSLMFVSGSMAESVCELVRVDKLTCDPVTVCDTLAASLFAVCGVSVIKVSHF